jgi:hypothetical protein
MAWFYLRLPGGALKVKPRAHLRSMEIGGHVPVLDLGFVIISWWSRKQLERDARNRAMPSAERHD